MSQISAAVYVATAGPIAPAASVAARPSPGYSPETSLAAAIPATGPNPLSTQVPTLIGEVTLNTRNMLRKRSGRPRSWIRQ